MWLKYTSKIIFYHFFFGFYYVFVCDFVINKCIYKIKILNIFLVKDIEFYKLNDKKDIQIEYKAIYINYK